MNIKEFANLLAPIIYTNAEAKKIPEFLTGIIIAQAWYESENYTTELSTKYNNLFNLKASLMWKGKFIVADKDNKLTVKKTFSNGSYKGFNTIEDCVAEFFKLISSPRYSNIKKSQNAADYIEKLKADGYKFKDEEPVKLIKIYEIHQLDKFDYKNSDNAKKETTTNVSTAIKEKISKSVEPAKTVKKSEPVKTTTKKEESKVVTATKKVVEQIKKPITKASDISKATMVAREKKPTVVEEPAYFNAYKGASNSIISALLSIGCSDTSLQYREKLAKLNNIAITPDFNIKLLDLLKQGKLRYK